MATASALKNSHFAGQIPLFFDFCAVVCDEIHQNLRRIHNLLKIK
jgi:hypothetical protein